MEERRGVAAVEAWTRPRPWASDAVLAVVLAILLLPSGLGVVLGAPWPVAARVGVIVVLTTLHLLVAVRRALPWPAFLAGSLAMLALVAIPDVRSEALAVSYGTAVPVVLLPSSLVYCVLLYSVTAVGSAVDSLRALAVGTVGAVLTSARLWSIDASAVDDLGVVTWRALLLAVVAAAVVVPWTLGRLRYVRSRYDEALAERSRRDDRAHVARELHDVVSHSLAVMVSQAEGARMMAARDPSVVVPTLDHVSRTGQEALRGMRGLLDALDPETAERTPQPGLAELDDLLDEASAAGLRVHRSIDPAVAAAPAVELVLHRIVQESLTNVLKHVGPGAEVTVRLTTDGEAVDVQVHDDGGPGLPPVAGRGLTGMQDRVRAVGGTLDAGPDDAGFAVRATVPEPGGAS